MRHTNKAPAICFFLALLSIVAVFVLALEPSDAAPMASHQTMARAEFELKADLSAEAIGSSSLKLDHVLAFGAICMLLLLAFGGRGLAFPVLLSLALAVLVEVGQGFVLTRNGQLQDLAPAALGIMVAIGLFTARSESRRA